MLGELQSGKLAWHIIFQLSYREKYFDVPYRHGAGASTESPNPYPHPILTKAPPTQPSKIIDLNYITISTCFLLLARPSQVEKHLINTFAKPACSSMHSICCCFKKARTGLHLKDKELCTVNQNV